MPVDGLEVARGDPGAGVRADRADQAATPRDPARPARCSGRGGAGMSFRDRRAIVTGAGSGIGQAAALQLLREGARVTGVDINDQGLEPLRAAGGDALVADLADLTARARVVEA